MGSEASRPAVDAPRQHLSVDYSRENAHYIAQTACEISHDMRASAAFLEAVLKTAETNPEYLFAQAERMKVIARYIPSLVIRTRANNEPLRSEGIRKIFLAISKQNCELSDKVLEECYMQATPDTKELDGGNSVRDLIKAEHKVLTECCSNYKGVFQIMLTKYYENLPESRVPDLNYMRNIAVTAVKLGPTLECEKELKDLATKIKENSILGVVYRLALQSQRALSEILAKVAGEREPALFGQFKKIQIALRDRNQTLILQKLLNPAQTSKEAQFAVLLRESA